MCDSLLAENKTPRLSGDTAWNVTLGQQTVFNITASDPDGDSVTVYLRNAPPDGATFTNESNIGSLTWTASSLDTVDLTYV